MASAVVNKVPYDFASLQLTFARNGEDLGIVQGIEEVSYTATVNREKIYGASRVPILRTDGDVEYDGSITFQKSWWDYLVAKAAELGVGLAMLEVTMAVSYYHDDAILTTDTLTGVRFGEVEHSHSRGPDPLQVTVPLDIMAIFFNGVDVFGNTL